MSGLPADPFFRPTQLPEDLAERLPEVAESERRRRIAWVAEVAEALLEGKQSSRAAALFVGGALETRLGDDRLSLEKLLRLRPRRGSHARSRIAGSGDRVKFGDEDEEAPTP